MCLIVLAHRASTRFPFVLAANRDEDYERPSRSAHFWEDASDVLGGRDERQGGSWLAITRHGRVAAITNVRGRENADAPSRGSIVAAFVRSSASPEAFAATIAAHGDEYAGFHLIAGQIGGTFVHVSNAGHRAGAWPDGVYGISNAAPGATWPKVVRATRHVAAVIGEQNEPARLGHALLDFLGTPGEAARDRGATLRDELEGEVFVMSDRYGTRSSTVIIASGSEILFYEQNYGRGGAPLGQIVEFAFPMEPEPR
jgi:uncharacterized protein with NRDE domain